MNRTRRGTAIALAGAATLALSVPAAQANVHPDYAPGAAVASAPVYDAGMQSYTWKCTYAGWAAVQVNWTCRLKDGLYGATYSQFSGSFFNGYFTTALYYYHKASSGVYLCTYAAASYNDGSASDSDQACR